jgi:hypothetical protein
MMTNNEYLLTNAHIHWARTWHLPTLKCSAFWKAQADLRKMEADVKAFDDSGLPKSPYALCGRCWEKHEIAKPIPVEEAVYQPSIEEPMKLGIFYCATCDQEAYEENLPPQEDYYEEAHICDYAGYGGACTDCGSLSCGCIDLCRGRCGSRRWSRW